MKKIAIPVLALFVVLAIVGVGGDAHARSGIVLGQAAAPAVGSAGSGSALAPEAGSATPDTGSGSAVTTTTTITTTTNAAPPSPESDLTGFLRTLYEAATTGKWKVFAGLVLLGLVYVSRRWVFGRVAWFKTKMGGVTLALIVSLGSTFGLALASGAALSLTAGLNAVATAVTAAGLWTWLQSASAPKTEKA